MSQTLQVTLLALLWFVYFVLHSWLASDRLKAKVAERFPAVAPAYRLLYNLLATLLLIPPLSLMWLWRTETVFHWTGGWQWLAWGLVSLALLVLALSMRHYDGSHFLGLKQWRERHSNPEQGADFIISPLHCYVRHPWYFAGLLLIWTRNMDLMQLVSSLALTLYLIIGSRVEESRLCRQFPEAYPDYRRQVPGLLPLPWKFLRRN